jgi:hypothetical protein
MDVSFLKQYPVKPDGETSPIPVPKEATHYKFKKGRINFYACDAGGDGFHEIPKGTESLTIKSRSHGERHIDRNMEWY